MSTATFISKRIFGSGSILATGKIIQLTLLLYIAQKMGVSKFGVFSLALAVAQFCSFVFVLGGQQGLTKIISRLRSSEQYDDLAGVIVFSATMYLVVVIALSFSIYMLDNLSFIVDGGGISSMAFLVAMTIWVVIREGISRGFSFIVISQLPHEVVAPLVILIAVLLDPSFVSSVDNFIFLWCVCFALVELFLLMFILSRFFHRLRQAKITYRFYEWSKELLAIQGASISKASIMRTDVLATGILLGTQEAGLYSIAQKLAQPITLMARTIFAATGSLVTQYYVEEKYSELFQSVKVATYFAILGSAVYLAAVLMLGEGVLAMIEEDYIAAFPILLILTLAICVDCVASPSGQFLVMCGYEKKLITFNIAGFVVYMVMMFSPYATLSGVHIASSVLVALFLLNVLSAMKTFRTLRKLSLIEND